MRDGRTPSLSGSGPTRILVLKPCCIGDVLLASPLVTAMNDAWPEARIEWAADSHSAAAAAGIPGVREVVAANGCVPGALNAASIASLTLQMSRRAYDMVVVPDRSRVLAWVARAARIPIRAGLDSGGRGRSYTIRVPVDTAAVRHEAELYLDIARAAGLAVSQPRLAWVPSEEDRSWAATRLAFSPADVSLHPGGGVNPGMTLASKRWPAERFASVVRGLLEEGRGVAILGGPTDATVVAQVMAAAPGALDLSAGANGADTLGRVAAVAERTRVFVGNDSGIAHLAMAVHVPAVVLFGPTDPRRYGPLPGQGIALAPPQPSGSPAVEVRLADADGSDAILQVRIEEVAAAVNTLLESSPSGRP